MDQRFWAQALWDFIPGNDKALQFVLVCTSTFLLFKGTFGQNTEKGRIIMEYQVQVDVCHPEKIAIN